MEKYSYCKYINIMKSRGLSEAQCYKDSFIPQYLYKYSSFGENDKLYENKMEQLAKEQIWASKVKYLNDPFEFKVLFSKLDIGDEDMYNEIIDHNEVISLTNSCTNKLMWSHYAEKHCGYCLEFKTKEKYKIMPVVYRKHSIDITRDIKSWFSCIIEMENKSFSLTDQELYSYRIPSEKFGRLMYYKDSIWKYENEYRIIASESEKEKDAAGSVHVMDEYGIHLSRVILGLNCESTHRKRIEDCVRRINNDRFEEFQKKCSNYDFDKIKTLFIYRGENVKLAQIQSNKNLELTAVDYN